MSHRYLKTKAGRRTVLLCGSQALKTLEKVSLLMSTNFTNGHSTHSTPLKSSPQVPLRSLPPASDSRVPSLPGPSVFSRAPPPPPPSVHTAATDFMFLKEKSRTCLSGTEQATSPRRVPLFLIRSGYTPFNDIMSLCSWPFQIAVTKVSPLLPAQKQRKQGLSGRMCAKVHRSTICNSQQVATSQR